MPAVSREGLAIGTEHGRHHRIGDPDGSGPVIRDAAFEPATVVAERDELCAIGRDPNG